MFGPFEKETTVSICKFGSSKPSPSVGNGPGVHLNRVMWHDAIDRW